MKIGLQMYTVRDYMKTKADLLTTLDKLSAIGIRSIQVSVPGFITAEELAAELKTRGMSADSGYMPTGEDCKQLEKALHEAACFGTDVIRTNSIPDGYRKDADGYRRYAEILNREGETCRANGIRYIYHFHAFEFVNFGETRGIDILLNDTDPKNVYFQPDVFWLTNAGTEPSHSLRMFEKRAFWMHVKDYAITQLTGVIESVPYHFAPVGEGNLNWPGILQTAKDMGIEKMVIEQDVCTRDVFDSIAASYQNLRAMGLDA